jgi:hypothetical protein
MPVDPSNGRQTRVVAKQKRSRVDIVAGILEDYARRGQFRGFSRAPDRNGKANFKVVWHRDSIFDFVYDFQKNTLRCLCVLPNVPADSSMYSELKQFIKRRTSKDIPEHRRIDARKASVGVYNRRGNVSLTLTLKDGDSEYGARKLVNLINEIFMTFLLDGRYFDYVVETFNLDPDRM